MNAGFLARQLALTELQGEAVDFPGGCLVLGDGLWAGIWEPEKIKDPEAYITQAQAKAEEYNSILKGVLLLIPGALERSECVEKLTEALYVYSYPKCDEAQTGPEMVQVLGRQGKQSNCQDVEIKLVSGADQMLTQALAVSESLAAAWNLANVSALAGADVSLAMQGGEPVGVSAVVKSDLASRLVLLWVKEQHRNQGIGTFMLSSAIESAQQDGKLLFSVWTHRTGKWRYFFNKRGFDEQLSAVYYRLEE